MRVLLSLFVLLSCLSGCVRQKVDQSLPLPGPPQVEHQINAVVVFPFGKDETVPQEVVNEIYRKFISYLIQRRKLYVLHPDVVKKALGREESVIDRDTAEKLAEKLGVEGFVIGFVSDFSDSPLDVTVDAQLYPLVNPDNAIREAHRRYDSSDIRIIARMKRYAGLFDWMNRPLGWERVKIKKDLFCDFVAWDLVTSFF